MIAWLRRSGGFWVAFVTLAFLTYVSPLLGLYLGFVAIDIVTGWMLLGSLVLALFIVEWGKVQWARGLLQELRKGDPAAVARIVRVNEFGRRQVKTLVLTLQPTKLTLRNRKSESTIALDAITEVRVAKYGPLRADSVVVETNLFGPIELVPLRSDAIAPVGDEEALLLAASITSLGIGDGSHSAAHKGRARP